MTKSARGDRVRLLVPVSARSGLVDGFRSSIASEVPGKTADLVEARWSPTAPKLLVVLPLDEEEDEVYV